jgi:uncharacterized protein
MRQAAKDPQKPGHIHAARIINRNHFRRLHEGMLNDIIPPGGAMSAKHIAEAASKEFGADRIRFDSYPPKDSTLDFPVIERNKTVVSARSKSQVLKQIPVATFDYVFVDKEILLKAQEWYEKNKSALLAAREEMEE